MPSSGHVRTPTRWPIAGRRPFPRFGFAAAPPRDLRRRVIAGPIGSLAGWIGKIAGPSGSFAGRIGSLAGQIGTGAAQASDRVWTNDPRISLKGGTGESPKERLAPFLGEGFPPFARSALRMGVTPCATPRGVSEGGEFGKDSFSKGDVGLSALRTCLRRAQSRAGLHVGRVHDMPQVGFQNCLRLRCDLRFRIGVRCRLGLRLRLRLQQTFGFWWWRGESSRSEQESAVVPNRCPDPRAVVTTFGCLAKSARISATSR